jgi:hypothetical protein
MKYSTWFIFFSVYLIKTDARHVKRYDNTLKTSDIISMCKKKKLCAQFLMLKVAIQDPEATAVFAT